MRPMQHGYTNHTVGDDTNIEKTYQGPDAEARLAREQQALRTLRGRLPVPAVHEARPGTLVLQRLPGTHGQELIEQGHAAQVLRACGAVLRLVHQVPATVLGDLGHTGEVLVHGDFGPNNTLLDPATYAVTALLDWEFAHLGKAIEDLAWCEWIIRTHHPEHVGQLPQLYLGYGRPAPAWPDRQAAMLDKCFQLQRFCERWEPGGAAVQLWKDRADATALWRR